MAVREDRDYDKYDVTASESLLENLSQISYQGRKSRIASNIWQCLQIGLMSLFVLSYSLVAYRFWNQPLQTCLLGNEAIYADIPISYDTVRFQRAGFHDDRHDVSTTYEGVPNLKNNAAWAKLLEVGVVVIQPEENDKLLNGTATARNRPDDYIVELEMFHQLHCLKWLRDAYWTLEKPELRESGYDEYLQRQNHTDHCIDYLRQAIMCHGDVTPITFEWNDGISGYLAHHSTQHQCRNFDSIYKWAASRDSSGLRSDGKHVNVDLSEHEKFD